jgi:hypothetical protein
MAERLRWYASSMMLAVAALAAVLLFLFYARRQKSSTEAVRDTTPVLDRWVREALEHELAEGVLGMRTSTEEERKRLARTLANDPDPGIVEKIEDTVKAVELEFVRYAHEADVEAIVRVRYENGKTGTSSRRLALADVPEAVQTDFRAKGSTRVFRTWPFPWQRIVAL